MVINKPMNTVLTAEEDARLIDAIREVEARTSAEIRICITPKRIWWHERFAWKLFDVAGMRKTRNRNAALIVVMPRVKKVVVIGDAGLNSVVNQKYWEETINAMILGMKSEGILSALLVGLQKLGDTLAEHWPRELDNPNEIADELIQ